MNLSKEVVLAAAHETRRLFTISQQELDRDLLVQLYGDYNSDIDNSSAFVEAALQSFPSGACGLASLYTRHLLDTGEVVRGNYELSNAKREGHTVLWLAELGIISCVTSDQFGGPRIYVGAVQAPYGGII